MKLYEHQKQGLKAAQDLNHVAFYWDMGLGKTFAGSEKMVQLGAKVNLIICQKSKFDDWVEHFEKHYNKVLVYKLTSKKQFDQFVHVSPYIPFQAVGIINYDLAWRRKDLLKLHDFTLMLDESSLIQNENSKRSKFILKLQPKNVILLSGTPTGGKYENLWSQLHLLGWSISKKLYWKQFVKVRYLDTVGRSVPLVTGYKNVDRLKRKMAEHGCQFLKTEEVFDLPSQNFQKIKVPASKEYKTFRKDKIIELENETLVGDTTLKRMLYERQLCGIYSLEKMKAFTDLLESTDDRLIVFYNFNDELEAMRSVVRKLRKPYSIINGSQKTLNCYETKDDSVTFVQYQAGAMGLNLQRACKMVFFTLPLSSELFEQAKKRIHRIGQEKSCFYYILMCKGSIEEKILATLEMRKDYTEALFEREIEQ